MPANDWPKIKQIFHDSLKVEAAERDEFVEKACDGDVGLQLEVESLLVSLGEAECFLERPVALGGDPDVRSDRYWRLKNGQKISHYQIAEPIDSGGMGEVYVATDLKLRRRVALKVLRSEVANDRERLKRFRREAEAVSSLNHPNIITVFDFDEVEDIHFFATELVEGETLRARLNRMGSLSLIEALDITVQAATALKAAHDTGVVHRDIKPENLMIRKDGYVKVLDFGLAKITEAAGSETMTRPLLSMPGMIMGTAAYMSPEQARAISIDHRTDIFSLGVVLYEVLTDVSPFKAATQTDTIAAIIQRDPRPPSEIRGDVPDELDRMIAKMVAKDRPARYHSAADLLVDLKRMQRRLELEAGSGRALQPEPRTQAETQVLGPAEAKKISSGGTTAFSNSIAVLPFANMSADPENEYFCDGLAEELLNALAKVEGIKVAARTSAFTFKNRNLEINEIGRALNVSTILEGSVRKSGDKLRITVQLVNVADGFHLWSERYDRGMKDIFDIQDEITLAVVHGLKVKLLGEERAAILRRNSDNAEAYELYLKGLYHSYKWTDASFIKSLEYFKKALEKDPGFAPAHAKIADYYNFHSFVGGLSPNEVIGDWRTAAQRALELDESLPEAHLAMAHIYFYHDRNWADAEHEFLQAIVLSPNSPQAHKHYGLFLVSRERFDEAVAEAKKALSLDPLSVAVNFVAAQTHFYADRFEDTRELVRMLRELDPNAPQSFWQEGKLLLADGRYEQAVEVLQKATASGDNQMALSMRGCAYGLAGRREEALTILDELFEIRERKYAAAFNIARVYAGLGDRDNAFEWLEKAIEERNAELVHLRRKAEVGEGLYLGDGFASDPRYGEICRLAGLPL
jgi:serine/threonine-protein kinase